MWICLELEDESKRESGREAAGAGGAVGEVPCASLKEQKVTRVRGTVIFSGAFNREFMNPSSAAA